MIFEAPLDNGKEGREKAVRAAREVLDRERASFLEKIGQHPALRADKNKIAAALESYDASEE